MGIINYHQTNPPADDKSYRLHLEKQFQALQRSINSISRAIVAPTTVAALPTDVFVGRLATVTDGAAALAWGATISGGGSTTYLVFYNGSNWTVVGK